MRYGKRFDIRWSLLKKKSLLQVLFRYRFYALHQKSFHRLLAVGSVLLLSMLMTVFREVVILSII